MNNDKMEQIEALRKLREPFLPNHINKLPKPTCSNDEYKKLPKATCKVCGGYHATTKTIHLEYVGHAALTDRLLDVDPFWNWEPVAVNPATGEPSLDKDGGMWINLTICGMTRRGYGDAQGKTGGNATKERIGDAIRNAAMRFGAALELWHKGDLHVDDDTGKMSSDFETEADGHCYTIEELISWHKANESEINKMAPVEIEKITRYVSQLKATFIPSGHKNQAEARQLYQEAIGLGATTEQLDTAIFKMLGRKPSTLEEESEETITVIMDTIMDVINGLKPTSKLNLNGVK
jgi:hypothetical protein